MFDANHLLHINYYDAMLKVNEYNDINLDKEQIHIVISKINDHLKFVKHIRSRYIYYVYLETKDDEIVNRLNEISKIPYEGDRRHHTANHMIKLFENPENKKKFIIAHIYQK